MVLGSECVAHALMKLDDVRKVRLFVASTKDHFVFTPMLASAAVGTVEYWSITKAVRWGVYCMTKRGEINKGVGRGFPLFEVVEAVRG